MRYLYTLAIVMSLLPCHRSAAQQVDTATIYKTLFKCWHSVSHEYSTIYGLEEDEIKNYAKQKVCLSRDGVELYSGPLLTPQYLIKKVNAESFAKDNFDCSKIKLGMIVDSVYEITISSMAKSAKTGALHKMTDVVAFDGNFLYVVKDGVIFKLYDANNTYTPRSSN